MPLDPADCARHFGMDAAKWATVCDRTSVHYRRVAGYRYDPAERLEKSRRYAEAAVRIQDGDRHRSCIGHLRLKRSWRQSGIAGTNGLGPDYTSDD